MTAIAVRVTAPKYIQYLNTFFSVSNEYIHIAQPMKRTPASQLL